MKQKKQLLGLILVLLFATNVFAFDVYTDRSSPNNHFIPTGWMGDYTDIRFNDRCMDNPHSGTSCIRIEHLPRWSKNCGWVGIYWQYPANNWGFRDDGFDLTGHTKLTFWARGEGIVSEFKVGGIIAEYCDTVSASIGPIKLNKEWTEYEIGLKGQDLSKVMGGFCFSASADDNPEGLVFYLDDIKFKE